MDADGPEAPGGRRVENLVWDEQVRYRRPAQAVDPVGQHRLQLDPQLAAIYYAPMTQRGAPHLQALCVVAATTRTYATGRRDAMRRPRRVGRRGVRSGIPRVARARVPPADSANPWSMQAEQSARESFAALSCCEPISLLGRPTMIERI
jgi:hypothetical protein